MKEIRELAEKFTVAGAFTTGDEQKTIGRFALAALDAMEARDAQHREDWGTPSRVVADLRAAIARNMEARK